MLRENPCEEIQGAATGEGQTEKLKARAERLPFEPLVELREKRFHGACFQARN